MLSNSNHLNIVTEKQGPKIINKHAFPLRYGRYNVITTGEFEFIFNLNGEIKFIRGTNTDWPHPGEQLKRTDGNDWVYYSIGDNSNHQKIISWFGEYYLPCLPYPSNSVWEIDCFSKPQVMKAFGALAQLFGDIYQGKSIINHASQSLPDKIINNSENGLHHRAKELNEIIDGRLSVLPPDTRHVDYEIIPLIIADGCLYHCEFCSVKSANNFHLRSKANITKQIEKLEKFYGVNLENYNGLFLGNHDALAAGIDLISFSCEKVVDVLGKKAFKNNSPFIFLFGSVDSFLNSKNAVFDKIDKMPFYTFINIGFESAHQPTLTLIGKPITCSKVKEAYRKMIEVNRSYSNIEITGNFLLGTQLPSSHYFSLFELLSEVPVCLKNKGVLYLSPLKDSPKKRELLPYVEMIKEKSPIPAYVYLIQRL